MISLCKVAYALHTQYLDYDKMGLLLQTPPSQPSSRDTSRRTTPRGSADSSRQGSSERPTADAPPTAYSITTHMLKKSATTTRPIERSASLQDVAGTSYASAEAAARDPRLRTRAQITPETARGPFDKAHRSPVKIPEAPKAFSRPPKRQQESDDEAKAPGRSTRQKIEVGEVQENNTDPEQEGDLSNASE
ncbi:hypothetical protein ACJJTC_000587 [Scirpophaga incertulas]